MNRLSNTLCCGCVLLKAYANVPSSYGVMVSTVDFESSDPGSNPGRSSILSVFTAEREKGKRLLLYDA